MYPYFRNFRLTKNATMAENRKQIDQKLTEYLISRLHQPQIDISQVGQVRVGIVIFEYLAGGGNEY